MKDTLHQAMDSTLVIREASKFCFPTKRLGSDGKPHTREEFEDDRRLGNWETATIVEDGSGLGHWERGVGDLSTLGLTQDDSILECLDWEFDTMSQPIDGQGGLMHKAGLLMTSTCFYNDNRSVAPIHPDRAVMHRFIRTVEKNYTDNPYHCFKHAFSVFMGAGILLRDACGGY